MHRQALDIDEQLDYQEGLTTDYTNLGNVYSSRGDLVQAEQMYRKALDIAERLRHLEGLEKAYINLGTVYSARINL